MGLPLHLFWREKLKINGKPLSTVNQQMVTFKRGDEEINLLVFAYRPGFGAMRHKYFPYPRPPKRVQSSTGRNGVTTTFDDEDSPVYLKQVRVYGMRYVALSFAEAVRLDPNFEWDNAKLPSHTDPEDVWVTFADTVSAELRDENCGLTDEEITAVMTTADKLSNSLNVDEAVGLF